MFFYDPTYFIVLPALIFAMVAQYRVSSTFNKYSRVGNRRNVTAQEVVQQILNENGVHDVTIERVGGNLTDHFDPRSKVIRLSDTVYNSTSVAAIGVAAHEAGHAVQYAEEYFPIRLRNFIIPVTQIGSKMAVPLVILGLIFNTSMSWLITAGILLYTAVVFFQAVTLPVEFNASRRALKILEERYILEEDETKMARKVLGAAAMTYVAAMFSALMQLLRLLMITGGRRRNND